MQCVLERSELLDALGKEVLPISAAAGKGLTSMLEVLWRVVVASKKVEFAEPEPVQLPTPPHRKSP